MGVFQVYFDETSTHEVGGTFRMVGLMAYHDRWPEFNTRWCAVLNEPPATPYWHTVSAHKGRLKVTFSRRRLKRSDREKKENALCAVLGLGGELGIIESVELEMPMAHFNSSVVGKVTATPRLIEKLGRKNRPTLEKPLFFMVGEAMRYAAHLARPWNRRIGKRPPVHIWSIFEENDAELGVQFEATAAYWALVKATARRSRQTIGPIVFLPSKGNLGQTTIQGADLFGWHINRMATTGVAQPGWEHLAKIKRNRRLLTKPMLARAVDRLNRGVEFTI